jgi:hypothetical protein
MHRTLFTLTLASLLLLAGRTPGTAAAEPDFEHQEIDKIDIGYGVAVGDVNGDGKPDILLADKKQFVWYENPGAGNARADWKKHIMVDGLTRLDNVAIAARDINGDGKVEVAVGAMWNPGETSNTQLSGSVHYLIRPADPTQKWTPVQLPHEPTTHRMRWMRAAANDWRLVVLPLHGRGNRGGEGAGVKVIAYKPPADLSNADPQAWTMQTIDDSMHMTHNLDVVPMPGGRAEFLLIAGKEGIRSAWLGDDGQWKGGLHGVEGERYAAGEVRAGQYVNRGGEYVGLYAAVEPMHGNAAVAYTVKRAGAEEEWDVTRHVLFDTMNQGHALAVADVLGTGKDQVVVGWRNPNKDTKVGIKLFVPQDDAGTKWAEHWVDDNGMATEDIAVADLDGDGDVDIVAAGRATRNLKVYWNRVK